MGTYYDTNETMKMLGCQYYLNIFKNEKRDAFNDMMNAYRAKGNIHYVDIAMDAFMLGYIYGKREERKKRKNVQYK